MKKIISLGGNLFQMSFVKRAKELGYYVIDVDYLPDNPAHRYADEYFNVSTLDTEGVLAVATDKKVDGIVSFASDVSAPTAAYVAEKLGLPTNSLDTVRLMTDKRLFHPFLKKNGFYQPESRAVSDEASMEHAYKEISVVDGYSGAVIIKPAHGSGSKGISVISDIKFLADAYENARRYSSDNELIIEQYIKREGYQIAGDAFVIDGKIVFFGFANEHFDRAGHDLVPIGESFPSTLTHEKTALAKTELQRAIDKLGFRFGPINMDFMFTENGDLFIIELAPRSGGNLISDAIFESYGIDLIGCLARLSVGDNIPENSFVKGKPGRFISSYVWHTDHDGVFHSIKMSESLSSKILVNNITITEGDSYFRFINGGNGIGAALLEFSSEEQMLHMMDHMDEYYTIN